MDSKWVHPEIDLHEFMVCVKAFVDMLILAGGFQSSGDAAVWDHPNTTKAFQWAIFLESILHKIPCSEEDQSRKALDTALLQLTSDPLFPKGLPKFSSSTLAESRKLLLEFLLRAIDLSDHQIATAISVVSEMDYNCPRSHEPSFIVKSLQHILQNPVDSGVDFPSNVLGSMENSSSCLMDYAMQEVTARHYAICCVRSLQHGLNILVKAMESRESHCAMKHILGSPIEHESRHNKSSDPCSQWRDNSLSYLVGSRTLSMVSGSNLIFSSTKGAWLQVFESLKGILEKDETMLLEMIEICLMGLCSERWNHLIRRFLSVTHDNIPVFKMWQSVKSLSNAEAIKPFSEGEPIHTKRVEIEEYLMQLLAGRVELLWKMPSILLAFSLLARSNLFSLYLNKIQSQICSVVPDISQSCVCQHPQMDLQEPKTWILSWIPQSKAFGFTMLFALELHIVLSFLVILAKGYGVFTLCKMPENS